MLPIRRGSVCNTYVSSRSSSDGHTSVKDRGDGNLAKQVTNRALLLAYLLFQVAG